MKTTQALVETSKLPYTETVLLLSELLAKDKGYIIAHPECRVSADIERRWQTCHERRVAGEPIAYILGKQEFFGYVFKVSSDVLIPRPETEELVSLAVDRLLQGSKSKNSILEIGTGSGAVIASIVLELKRIGRMNTTEVVAVDISENALNLAQDNIKRYNVAEVVQLLQGDMFKPVQNRRFDIIVANLPYLPTLEAVQNKFEPCLALDGGESGNECIARFLEQVDRYLNKGGVAYYERYNGEIQTYESTFGMV